jgi:hypothetical protein
LVAVIKGGHQLTVVLGGVAIVSALGWLDAEVEAVPHPAAVSSRMTLTATETIGSRPFTNPIRRIFQPRLLKAHPPSYDKPVPIEDRTFIIK